MRSSKRSKEPFDDLFLVAEMVVEVSRADIQLVGDHSRGHVRLAALVEEFEAHGEDALPGALGAHRVAVEGGPAGGRIRHGRKGYHAGARSLTQPAPEFDERVAQVGRRAVETQRGRNRARLALRAKAQAARFVLEDVDAQANPVPGQQGLEFVPAAQQVTARALGRRARTGLPASNS